MLGVLLQVVGVVVGGLFVAWTGRDGGQGAVLGDDIRTHTALCPGHSLGSLSVLPAGEKSTVVKEGPKTQAGIHKRLSMSGRLLGETS